MVKTITGAFVTILVLLYFVSLVLHISANTAQYEWDFRTHRMAAEVFAAGQDPYDPEVLSPKSGTPLLYTYPPVTLFFYRLFARMDYQTASQVFLVAKCLLLIGLVVFWSKAFLQPDAGPLFYIFCLMAFNSAVFLDLIAGNINLLEQVFLWLGFWFFLKHRPFLLSVCVLLAASFKMIPVFFLILLLLQKQYRYFIGAAAAFAAYLLIQYIAAPQLFTEFLRNALIVVGERGRIVPSTYTLISDFFQALATTFGMLGARAMAKILVLVMAAAVLGVSGKAIIRLRSMAPADGEKAVLFLMCFVYALIHPRFKDYAYMLLLVPGFYVLKTSRPRKPFFFLFLLAVIASPQIILPGLDALSSYFWNYYPLMIAYCLWGIFVYEIFRDAVGRAA